MKYCRRCKTRARDQETHCAVCGDELTLFGARPAAGGASDEPTLQLAGQIAELEATRRKNIGRSRVLWLAAVFALIGFLAVGWRIYAATVLVYAVLDKVEIIQDPKDPWRVIVSFNVVQPGRVSFERRSGGRRTEKVDQFRKTGSQTQYWIWESDPATGIDFDVIYRSGWTRTFERKHFEVAAVRPSRPVDVVFLLDTTGSMSPFIQTLKAKCVRFAEAVRGGERDVRLGLVGFGDVGEREPIHVFAPVTSAEEFRREVDSLPMYDGGDNPESSVDAIERALGVQYRGDALVCFIHITDAHTHRAQELERLTGVLRERGIMMCVVSRTRFRSVYEPLCVNRGEFFAIEQANFESILDRLATSISSALGSGR